MRKIRLTNAEGRDARIAYTSPRPEAAPKLGLKGENVTSHTYLAASAEGLHESLAEKHGDYAQLLVEGDPEVDIEAIGQRIGPTDNVFLDAVGEVLFAPPEQIEVILNPDGSEKARREPEDSPANVNEDAPLRWTKMRLDRGAAARRFAFRRSIQIRHVDGLSYDYLYTMAKELDEADEVVYIGGGPKGKDALVFQNNGSPYRGFLEGRVDGDKYKLLLHLSSLELKTPKDQG